MGHTSIDEASPADVEAVTRVATEYFQSWFAGNGVRMRNCLHPALAKRTPEEPGSETLSLHEDPTEALVADTASGEGTEFDPWQQVTVLDVFRDIATVMVRSEPFVEYLHLARFGSSWLIVNALYFVLVEH
jgi:Putative lumazine-binding